jgi:hypothetical protein
MTFVQTQGVTSMAAVTTRVNGGACGSPLFDRIGSVKARVRARPAAGGLARLGDGRAPPLVPEVGSGAIEAESASLTVTAAEVPATTAGAIGTHLGLLIASALLDVVPAGIAAALRQRDPRGGVDPIGCRDLADTRTFGTDDRPVALTEARWDATNRNGVVSVTQTPGRSRRYGPSSARRNSTSADLDRRHRHA